MAIIVPRGSLAFTGFGDTPMQFLANDGAPLAPAGIRFPTSSDRLTGLFDYLDVAADWTIYFRANYPGGGTVSWGTFVALGDTAYALPYIWFGTTDAGEMVAEIYDGTNYFDALAVSAVFGYRMVPMAVRYTGATRLLELIVDHVVIASITTDDLSAVTFGSDAALGQEALLSALVNVSNFRVWAAKLTLAEIRNEEGASTAQRQTDLLVDTPLMGVADLADLQPGSHDWTVVGAPETASLIDPTLANPECGAGCDGIVALSKGGYAVVGGNTPNFGATGTGTFSSDFRTTVNSAAGANGYAGLGIGRDGAGRFYTAGSSGGSHWIFRYSAAGVQTQSWNVGGAAGSHPVRLAVNAAGTIAYFIRFSDATVVQAWDLVGNVSLGTFTTEAGAKHYSSLVTCPNGDVIIGWQRSGATSGYVKHYNSVGSLLYTYTLTGTNTDPTWVTNGRTPTSIWVAHYDSALTTFSTIRVVEIELGTGTVLHSFVPEDGSFEFDGAFAVVSADITDDEGYLVTVDGVERDPLLATFNISAPINGVSSMRADFDSAGSPLFRPDLDAEITVREYGTKIFGGYITGIRERGFDGPNGMSIVVETTSADYKVAATRRVVNETLTYGSPVGSPPTLTLKEVLEVIVPTYLGDYGITLDPAQVDGPSLDPVVYVDRVLKDVLDELSVLTGYVWDIDVDKVFRMFAIGDEAAPFDLDESDLPARYFGDITVEPTRDQYANRVFLRYGPEGSDWVTDVWVGDGVTDTFSLSTTPLQWWVVVHDEIYFETIGDGTAIWTIDTLNKTITRVNGTTPPPGAPAAGASLSMRYIGQFPVTLTAEDAGEIATHGLFEMVVPATDTTDLSVAQARLTAELAKHLTVLRRITYSTRELGVKPGQTQHIDVPLRDLDTDAVIMEVVTESEPGGDALVRRVTAVEGAIIQGDWRDLYRKWIGA